MTPRASARDDRLVAVTLDEGTIGRSGPNVARERAVAISDLLADNSFALIGRASRGPYALHIGLRDGRLLFDIRRPDGTPVMAHLLSLRPFKRIIKDYFLICDSYYASVRRSPPQRIEAIDMGRRGLHDEGSRILREALERKVRIDTATARRLFTLVCVLHWKG